MTRFCKYEVLPGRVLSFGLVRYPIVCPKRAALDSFYCEEHKMLIQLATLQDVNRFVDHSTMKLGRDRRRVDSRTLRAENYFPKDLPLAPAEINWTNGIKVFGMMGNDLAGDCTFAGFGHAVQTWTVESGTEITIPDSAIVGGYSTLTGYVPGRPETDNGANELDVLNFVRKNGVGGRTILGYGSVEPANLERVKQTVMVLGGTYIGLALPLSAQSQNVWDVTSSSFFARLFGKAGADPTPGSWGGHCVWVPWYNALGPICVTWSALKQMTWAFWSKYCEEAYALASPDWLTEKVNKVVGINLTNWQADVQALAA